MALASTLLAISGASVLPGPAVADPSPGPPAARASRAAAEQALAAVERAFSAAPRARSARPPQHRDLTIHLAELARGLDDLETVDRARAEQFLARPTDGSGEYAGANYADDADPTKVCTGLLCVHYATATRDAPPATDADDNGVPDQVDRTRTTMTDVWDRIVTAGGYRAPLPDGTLGGNAQFDVYLADIGDQRLYGFCTTDQGAGRARDAYCVLDDDFSRSEFPSHTPLENLQVTAAHEFFHAVQFAYDFGEDGWFMESSAAWIEDELYDDVNDNYGYLPYGSLGDPSESLDASGGLGIYGNWLWWRYLTDPTAGPDRFAETGGTGLPLIMRDLWEQTPTTYSIRALQTELAARGRDLGDVFAEFAVANRRPSSFYEEGAAYGRSPLQQSISLSRSQRTAVGTRRLDHLSSATVAVRPRDDLDAAGWKLRIRVELPSLEHAPAARVTVVGRDGSVVEKEIVPGAEGIGRTRVQFRSTKVSRVELALVNGGSAFVCDRGTSWSCEGVPRSENRDFAFRVRALR